MTETEIKLREQCSERACIILNDINFVLPDDEIEAINQVSDLLFNQNNETAILINELEDAKLRHILDKALIKATRGNAEKLLEALNNINSIPYAGECGNIAYRAISDYEKGGENDQTT